MKDCSFCKMFNERKYIHYEDSLFWGMFDFNPVSPGHILIIPKRHVINLGSLSKDEWDRLQRSIRDIIHLIETTDLKQIYQSIIDLHVSDNSVWFATQALNNPNINKKPDAYNHGINDGKAAGRTVDHLHWHIIPRFEGDMDDPRGGVRYVIPKMGNYKLPKP
ncbi:MAG: HIT family protein [Patescibacteria group bacterium]